MGLEGPTYYFQYGFILITAANLVAILLLIAFFVAAVLLRFPGRRRMTVAFTPGRAECGLEEEKGNRLATVFLLAILLAAALRLWRPDRGSGAGASDSDRIER